MYHLSRQLTDMDQITHSLYKYEWAESKWLTATQRERERERERERGNVPID